MTGSDVRRNGVRLGAVGMLTAAGLLGSAGLAATASAAAPAPAAPASCSKGAWEPRIQGRPAGLDAGDRGADYLWHDTAGFHLRVTHRGDRREVYSGEITASSAVHVSRSHLERGDVLRLSADRRTIVFAFVDHGFIDGADFTTDCAASVTVSHLEVGNSALPVGRVDLGTHKAHPARVPFTVVRAAAA